MFDAYFHRNRRATLRRLYLLAILFSLLFSPKHSVFLHPQEFISAGLIPKVLSPQ